MSATPIPGTLRVQCKCGWQGTTEDLKDKTCPICGEAFEAYPRGREVYMREFEDNFETSVNNMKMSAGIDRSPNPWWKNRS
jgi:hypothetical protein